MTPEQLREQAAVNEEFAEASDREGLITDMRLGRQNAAALRAAADQLEAVRVALNNYAVTDEYNPGMEWAEPEDVWRLFRDLRTILTAGTAPQENDHG